MRTCRPAAAPSAPRTPAAARRARARESRAAVRRGTRRCAGTSSRQAPLRTLLDRRPAIVPVGLDRDRIGVAPPAFARMRRREALEQLEVVARIVEPRIDAQRRAIGV